VRNPAFVVAALAGLASWANWDVAGEFVLAVGALILAILFIGWTHRWMGPDSRLGADRRL